MSEPSEILTYQITDRSSIICLRCHRESFNKGDVEHHYCGHCNVFHDDILPLVREWWVQNGNLSPDAMRTYFVKLWELVTEYTGKVNFPIKTVRDAQLILKEVIDKDAELRRMTGEK
jgi:hypothetical protein